MRKSWRALFGLATGLAVLTPVGTSAGASTGDEPPDQITSDHGAPDQGIDIDDEGGEESGRVPLVEAPSGCLRPELPDVVFVGTAVDRDFRTVRFETRQVRAGDAAPFEVEGFIDVRYGLDVQYFDLGADYLVSARRDPVIGVLASRVRPPVPEFGGDDIVGLAETDVECPGFEDPVITLHPDGTAVDTSVLAPLLDSRPRLLAALVVPLAIAFGLVFVLAMLRLGVAGVVRGVAGAARQRRRVSRVPR